MTTQPQRISGPRAVFAGLAMMGLVSGCAVGPDGRINNLAGEPMFRIHGNQDRYGWDKPGAAVVVHPTGSGYTHYNFRRSDESYYHRPTETRKRIQLFH